jgi:hypothetical protein
VKKKSGSCRKACVESRASPGFLGDHEGKKFWNGIAVYNAAEGIAVVLASWVRLAAGYAPRDLNTPNPDHEAILALGLDLRKLPGNSHFLRTMYELLN